MSYHLHLLVKELAVESNEENREGRMCSESKPSRSVGLKITRGIPSCLHYPECQVSLSLAYFVSLWRQMVHPRARSVISHHHLGTARKLNPRSPLIN